MAKSPDTLAVFDAALERYQIEINRHYELRFLPEPRDVFKLYRKSRDFLTFPQLQNWKACLLAFSVVYFAASFYLFYRQYRVLQRSTRPKVLDNVLTNAEFTNLKNYLTSDIKFTFFRELWKLIVSLLLITLDVLPKIWYNLDIFIWNFIGRSLSNSYQQLFEHAIILPLFYLVCAFLWTILMAPSTFYEKCILGTSPPKGEKQTPRQWIDGILRYQFTLFLKVWFIIYFTEGDVDLQGDCDRAYHTTFNSLQDLMVLLTMYHLVARPLLPARFINLVPLRPGKTRSAIEALAKKLAFPLGSIYTCNSGNRISISGWLGKRSIAISLDTFEKCNTEDIVALVAVEMGHWKHGIFQQLALKFLATMLYLTPISILHFNWQAVAKSFGFKRYFIYSIRHPFQILVLIMGGALDLFIHQINSLMFEVARRLQSKANALAVRRGYGIQLARALIKLEKDKIEPVVADSAYLKCYLNGDDLLHVVLKDLGWTGEEKMEEEEKSNMNDHWEID